ncbi:MAG: 30S ribosomal protein S4 [Pirellulales bacterium]
MAHYIGPKARVNRRLNSLVFEDSGAGRAFERRPNPPGMRPRVRRPSNYGLALIEKQKIKYYYGLGERQLRRYFDKATAMKGNTGQQLLLLCERRLDNIIRRAGFAKTRPQARQGVTHGHFMVNGHKVDRPSFMVRPGDVITVRPRPNIQQYYLLMTQESHGEPTDWLTVDNSTLRITVQGLPGPSDISLPVDVNTVVEFLSR